MCKLYKVLTSIFVILVLTAILVSALETSKKGKVIENDESAQVDIVGWANKPEFSAIFSNNLGTTAIELPKHCESNPGTCPNIASLTFYLPVRAYVYVDVSAQVIRIDKYAQITLIIDNTDYMTRSRLLMGPPYQSDVQISATNLLEAGYHTIYISGYQVNGNIDPTMLWQLSITAIANQNGNMAAV